MTTGIGATWLVSTATLPCALVEVTSCGTSVIGAPGIKGEGFVETKICPWLLVEICTAGIAAAEVM